MNHRDKRIAALLDGVRCELRAVPPAFGALCHAMQLLVGYKVLTVLKFDPATFRSLRVFSTEPTYPTGVWKEHDHGEWTTSVLKEGRPFLAATMSDIRRCFPDAAQIAAAGCGATLGVPTVYKGRVLGSLNLWHESGHFREETSEQVAPFAQLLIPVLVGP